MSILSKTFSSLLFLLFTFLFATAQKTAIPFSFEFEDKTLHGLIETPENKTSKSVVLLIPGYGRTDFVEGNWFGNLRDELTAAGLTVVFWDKMGCGKSEGNFDAQQPVENSADESVAAIEKLKTMKVAGAETIGCWGLSRAGWIVPLINERYPIDFWISVSGTNDKENFGYLLKENLLIEGKSPAEAERLYQAWMEGHRLYSTSPDYKAFLKAIKPLTQDPMSRRLFGYNKPPFTITKKAKEKYAAEQATFTTDGYFDESSGLWVYIEYFDQMLSKMNCPVLAIFGENDSQVDWRQTKLLYEQTIGKNDAADLTAKVFEQCNHILKKCITCGWKEDLSAFNWAACDGYYETMKMWLKEEGFVE
ncbi:MAG: alpha/beta hydrolase [Bacteroidota bacterium]